MKSIQGKKSKIAVSMIAAVISLGSVGSAFAQNGPGRGRGPDGNGPPGQQRMDDRRDYRGDYRGDDRRNDRPGPERDTRYDNRRPMAGDGRGAGPDHNFRRGEHLPTYYRGRQYVVDDWRGHRLSAPPRGYHWVQTGGDYVLVAVATGIIAQILLGN